jgi:hypothetical protein
LNQTEEPEGLVRTLTGKQISILIEPTGPVLGFNKNIQGRRDFLMMSTG